MQQSTALDILKSGRNVFLTGAPGAGKTYVLNQYIEYLRHRGVGVAVTASTGIAATHLGGKTIHSWSGIGIKDYLSEEEIDALTQKQYLHKNYKNTDVLIIDEISMLSASTLDTIDEVARAMKQNPAAFGGMQVVLSGDFFQLPPISRSGEISFAYEANVWRKADIRTCYITEQHRQSDDTFSEILEAMRTSSVTDDIRKKLDERMNTKINMDITPVRLFTHNVDVDSFNSKELDKIEGEEYTFAMTTKGRANMVESLTRTVLTPEELVLKKGAAVMFVKNNFEMGYVNGTLGTVVDFDGGTPVVEIANGDKILAERAEWRMEDDGKILASVEQIPLRLAWAITVHKSQGMSLDAVEIDLGKSFVPGQGYVALSRAKTLEGLVLTGLNDTALMVDNRASRFDDELQADSENWAEIISKFSKGKIKELHDGFITMIGGTLDEKEIEKNKKKKAEVPKKKIPTQDITKSLIDEGYSIEEIAKKRELTVGTIIGHMEKLREKNEYLDLSHLAPDSEMLDEIHDAIRNADEEGKLTPIHKALNGKYTFDQIRLAKVFFVE